MLPYSINLAVQER